MSDLLSHPYLQSLRSIKQNHQLIRVGEPLPIGLNPYVTDSVVVRLALAYGEVRSIKEIVAYNIIVTLIQSGKLHPGDVAIDATSGNTGKAYAGILQPLGIYLRLIVQGTIPEGKLAPLRVYGKGVEIVPHFGGSDESTVMRARREAEENGYVLLDQYASNSNPQAHEFFTGPNLWEQLSHCSGTVAAVIVPLGTCGTALGLSRALKARDKNIRIIGVACDPDQRVPQIPGMRTLDEIKRDVRLPWEESVDEVRLAQRADAVRSTRRLAYAEPSFPGLSTGAAYDRALAYIHDNRECLHRKTVIVIAPDSIEPYLGILQAEQDDADVAKALSDRPEF